MRLSLSFSLAPSLSFRAISQRAGLRLCAPSKTARTRMYLFPIASRDALVSRLWHRIPGPPFSFTYLIDEEEGGRGPLKVRKKHARGRIGGSAMLAATVDVITV